MEILKLLVQHGLINKEELLKFASKKSKVYLGSLIEENILNKEKFYDFIAINLRHGKISFKDIENLDSQDIDTVEVFKYLAKKFNIEYIDLNEKEIDTALLSRVPISILLKNRAIVIEEDDIYITVVFADPFEQTLLIWVLKMQLVDTSQIS